jgi:hypothetical protein
VVDDRANREVGLSLVPLKPVHQLDPDALRHHRWSLPKEGGKHARQNLYDWWASHETRRMPNSDTTASGALLLSGS